MSLLPAELSTGKVTGRFIIGVIDGVDPDQDPDAIPATGKVVFKASVPYIPVPVTAEGPVTLMKGPITGILDDEGYLCTPYPAGHPQEGRSMYRGVKLLATDDPDGLVTDWTWSAEVQLDRVGPTALPVPAFSFALPSNTELDLTTLVKVPSSPGYGLPQAEAAVIRAEQSAADARADADAATATAGEALTVANGVRADADAGLFKGDKGDQGDPGNATMRIDTTAGTRVFITDGTTERLITGSTGWRDVSSLLLAGVTIGTSGWARMKREGNTVFLNLKNVTMGAAATENYVIRGYPIGMRPAGGTHARIPAYMRTSGSTPQLTGLTIRYAERDVNVADRVATPTFGDQYTKTEISWTTDDAWPSATDLANLPAV